MKERIKQYKKSYEQTEKGKEARQRANKKYYLKKKLEKYDNEHNFNLDDQLNKKPTKSILRKY